MCKELDSVKIFDSEAVQLSLKFAWLKYGLMAYMKSGFFYLLYVLTVTITNFTFSRLINGGFQPIAIAMVISVMAFNIYFIIDELVSDRPTFKQ